jgi:hypothetical protein
MGRRGQPRAAAILAVALWALVSLVSLAGSGGVGSISADSLRPWLTYLASDELEGRATFSAGLGLAAGYIERHLQEWGVQPGADGSYLQVVRVLGVKATSRGVLTVRVGNETRTFKDGEGIRFPRNAGAKRTVHLTRVEFAGYGLDAPGTGHMDFNGKDVRSAAVVWLGTDGPSDIDARAYRRFLTGRHRYVTEQLQALATIGPEPPPAAQQSRPETTGRAVDFTTAQRLDHTNPPALTASDEFFEFLFSRAPVAYAELKRKAAAREPLPSFRLDGVTLSVSIDSDYEIVRTQLTQNVVGIVAGSEPRLKDSYLAYGAHYDHVGYAEGDMSEVDGRRPTTPGRVSKGAADDRIWNGADDDGSGTVALMAIARAFAEGTRPKRSVLFVWHTGEERGLWGSRYFVDHPTVPLTQVVAQLNADMIGRNRDDKTSEANTVYLVGSDRISSELHDISREANRALPTPLTLDYELNDVTDLEQIYYRSDHYSYAAKGIPIIFFTTGLHSDYHTNTDHASKIEYEKLARIAQLMYETGFRVANLDHPPVRDRKGPRAGKATPAQ